MPEPSNGLRWQVENHERRLGKLEDLNVAVLAERVHNLEQAVQSLRQSVDGDVRALRRAFYSFALSIAGSAVIFAFTIFTVIK